MQNETDNVEARIIELYESGDYSKTGICEELGVGKKKLYRVLREADLIPPEGTNPRPTPVPVQGSEHEEDLEDGEPEDEDEDPEILSPVVMGSPIKLALGAAAGLAGGYMIWGRRRPGESQDPVDRGRALAQRLLSLLG